MKKIYLHKRIIGQLKSDDIKVWTKNIPYHQKPSKNFPYELDLSKLSEDDSADFLIEGGIMHPSRMNPDSLLELLVKVM